MKHQTFELILISPPEEYPQEAAWVNKLFAEGLGVFHLRKPGWTSDRIIHYFHGVEAQYHSRIMVHYQEEVRNHLEVGGIHYQYKFLPQQKPPFRVSCGLHTWEEFRTVEDRIDYAFISPFFNSISKAGYPSNLQLWQIPAGADIKKAVALGGIKAENIAEIQGLGLRGAAVLGAVWHDADPLEAFLKLKKIVK